MVKNNQQTFKQLYQEQYECYPALTQDEVVALYATEGINAETDEEITKKLQKYLDLKKQELKNLKYDTSLNSYIRSVFGLPVDDELTELEDYISALEEHTKAIQQVHQATPENSEEFHVSLETIEALYYDLRPNSFDEYDAAIEDGICQLIKGNTSIEDGIENLIYQIADKKTQVEEMKKRNNLNKDAKAKTLAIETLNQEIENLETKLKELENTKNNHTRQMYISTRGFIPRDRIFPSTELRNKIAVGFLGFAKYWVRVYYYKSDNTIPYDDLFQIASEALLSAAHYYIPNEQAKFTTYARKCIENKLKKAIYSPKKMPKRPYPAKDFFTKEQDNIQYLKWFLAANKTTWHFGKGNSTEGRESNPQYILKSLRNEIRAFNRTLRLLDQSNRSLPSISFRKTEESPEETLKAISAQILKIIKDSKLHVLINDDDRYFACLIIDLQENPEDLKDIYQLEYFLYVYAQRLDLIAKYLQAEAELQQENGGITPTDKEIMQRLNTKNNELLKERKRLQKLNMTNTKLKKLDADEFVSYENHLQNLIDEITATPIEVLVLPHYNETMFYWNKYDDIAFKDWENYDPQFPLAELATQIEQNAPDTCPYIKLYSNENGLPFSDWCPEQTYTPSYELDTGEWLGTKSVAIKKLRELSPKIFWNGPNKKLVSNKQVFTKAAALAKLQSWLDELPASNITYTTKYRPLSDYYSYYLYTYNVDPFISKDDYEDNGISSKQKERDDIAAKYQEQLDEAENAIYMDSRINQLKEIIEEIEDTEEETIYLHFSDESGIYDNWFSGKTSPSIEDTNYYLFSKDEAISKLEHLINIIIDERKTLFPILNETDTDYVKRILNERKNHINKLINDANAGVIVHNQQVNQIRALINQKPKSFKALTIQDIKQIKTNLEILFDNDGELMLLINGRPETNPLYSHLVTEDEALNNIFMTDYYMVVNSLPERERKVLLSWFDVNGMQNMSAKEIADDLGIAPNAIYRIKARALKLLSQHPTMQKYLEDSLCLQDQYGSAPSKRKVSRPKNIFELPEPEPRIKRLKLVPPRVFENEDNNHYSFNNDDDDDLPF